MNDLRIIENSIKDDIEDIFFNILTKYNFVINISSNSRGGAEISDFLEDEFVKYLKENPHNNVTEALGASKENTKSPYDFCFVYKSTKLNFKDLIWGDIKATKKTYKDSNPDLGTPEKIIKFILEGHFYMLFVFLEYIPTKDNKTQFVKFDNGKYVKCIFLKDIHNSVRINPKPQFQVNIKAPSEYRSIDDFINLFYKKYTESIDRNIKKQLSKKEKLKSKFDNINNEIKNYRDRKKINK